MLRSALTLILSLAVVCVPVVANAQAPIERRPPSQPVVAAVPPAASRAQADADTAWERLARGAHRGYLPEVRVQAVGGPIRCDLDQVTPYELFCVEHRAMSSPWRDAMFPREAFRIPRSDIRDVRTGGRDASTALGALIGAGVGVGVGSIHAESRASGGQLWGALLLGTLGGCIGHLAPFKGHVVYRQP